jgi:hypothetical protein
MRVRLVRPLLAEIAQLDTLATAQVPGYDPDFQEPRAGTRQEKPLIQVPAQIEITAHAVLQQSMAGNVPDSRLVLVMDYADLARRGLIDPATNETTLRTGDRLVRLLNGIGVVIETYPNPPGMFLTELRPVCGLARDRNLLLAFFNDREQGLVRGAA